MNKRKIGRAGEDIAASFLEGNGIKIIERNYFTKFGEIDLIGFEKQTIIFIEVKLRNNCDYGIPIEGISADKKKRIYNSALYYLSNVNFEYKECRFDIVGILLDRQRSYKIEWLKRVIF